MSFLGISRRAMLRGLGVSLALPYLDAMGPLMKAASAAVPVAAKSPLRIAFVFLPNGVSYTDWVPSAIGREYPLSPTLQPLESFKSEFSIFSGLTLDGARAKNDGGGDHARSAAAFLTGSHPRKTAGKDIRNGMSIDQMIAKEIGSKTRLPSLELGMERAPTSGSCDSGYSCAYSSNISWKSETTPMAKEIDPAALFDRLVGSALTPEQARRMRDRKSILDLVADDAKTLDRRLGNDDQRKLDEFTTSIREIERRIEFAQKEAEANSDKPKPDMDRPQGVPSNLSAYMRLMFDLQILAMRMDTTRVSTMMLAAEGSDRKFRFLGATEGHHTISHHSNDKAKQELIRKIDLFHMQQFAYFLDKLKSTRDGDGSLLDHSLIMLGAGISDGNRHNHDNLPILLAGHGNGSFKPGEHVKFPKETPLCNLYLSLMEKFGVKQARFGDSTGTLSV